MVTLTMSESSPSKMVHITIPGSGSGFSSPRTESISQKMKKILTSPKGMRGKSGEPAPCKTFGVLLEYLFERDHFEVPVIVSRLCEYLKKNGMRQEGLFRVNGNIKVVERLKGLFDKNGDADLEDIGDVPACASLLKMFLRELTDPVIPEDLQPLFINVQHKYCQDKPNLVPRVKQFVQRMPKLNVALLRYLCEFMIHITNSSEGNKMTPLALAIVFGPNIFRCGEGLNGLRDQAYVNAVLLLMLQEYETIFGEDEVKESRDPPERPLSYSEHMKRKQDKSNNENICPEKSQNHHDDKSNKTEKATSPEKTSSTKSKGPLTRKDRPSSQVKSTKTPGMSLSPTYSVTSSSTPMSKQLVENTINIAVKEILFGPGMVTSSCESDRHDDSKNDESAENIYRSKNFPFDMTEETLNEGLICQTRRTRSVGTKKERRIVYERCMSSPQNKGKKEITDEDLEFACSSETLERLTSARVQPPRNRRKPSFRGRSEKSPGKEGQEQINGSLPVNNVNKEFVYTTYDNETNLNVKNIDNISKNNNMQYNQDSSCVGDSRHDRYQDVPSHSKSTNQTHSLVYPSQSSQPVTPLHSSHHPSIETRRLHDREDNAPLSPRDKCSSPQDSIPLMDMSPPSLKKKIVSLKKIINNLEANFEETNGRKPKAAEKGQIQKYISELARTKKQLKELLADHKGRNEMSPERSATSHPRVTTDNGHRDELTSKGETLTLLLKKLADKRVESGRPEDILAMSSTQLRDEKLAVQKALLMYENQHGRPSSKEDKTLMRPLYDRYRKIKRLIATGKPESTSRQNSNSQVPPPYNEQQKPQSANYTKEQSCEEATRNRINTRVSNYPNNIYSQHPYDTHKSSYETTTPHERTTTTNPADIDQLGDTFMVTNRLHETLDSSALSPPFDSPRASDDAILHDATMNELLEQQRLTKRSKKRLGKLLKDFEEDFFNQYNRKVQKNDRLPKQEEYREYKLIKAKLRLVEALIEKKKSQGVQGEG